MIGFDRTSNCGGSKLPSDILVCLLDGDVGLPCLRAAVEEDLFLGLIALSFKDKLKQMTFMSILQETIPIENKAGLIGKR